MQYLWWIAVHVPAPIWLKYIFALGTLFATTYIEWFDKWFWINIGIIQFSKEIKSNLIKVAYL